jgi:hypothetical protein
MSENEVNKILPIVALAAIVLSLWLSDSRMPEQDVRKAVKTCRDANLLFRPERNRLGSIVRVTCVHPSGARNDWR